MNKEQCLRSFISVKTRCADRCPFGKQCIGGKQCVFDNISLIMKQDSAYIAQLENENLILKQYLAIAIQHIKDVENINSDYWTMINAYNVAKRKVIRKKKRRYRKKMTSRDKTIYDGDERYAQEKPPAEYYPEVII